MGGAQRYQSASCAVIDGYRFAPPVLQGLLHLARNNILGSTPATHQPDGQISKNLSSPARKNKSLHAAGQIKIESACLTRCEGRSRSSRTCGEMRWTRRGA